MYLKILTEFSLWIILYLQNKIENVLLPICDGHDSEYIEVSLTLLEIKHTSLVYDSHDHDDSGYIEVGLTLLNISHTSLVCEGHDSQ